MRRGKEKADIFCICFDLRSQRLACSSDRNTIHVFTVNLDAKAQAIPQGEEELKEGAEPKAEEEQHNKKARFGFLLGKLSKYFDSEWSYAKFKLPNTDNG